VTGGIIQGGNFFPTLIYPQESEVAFGCEKSGYDPFRRYREGISSQP
jgi:hypothetical protein